MPDGNAILELEHLGRYYPVGRRRFVQAVDGVDLTLRRGETLALVGESGCGKSTLARLMLRLEPVTFGRIRLEGDDITDVDARRFRDRRRMVQMIFQDAYGSLDPRMTAEAIVREPLDNYRLGNAEDRRLRARNLLARVGLGGEHCSRYPHELSGGQRQRLGIARALALEPKIIVADEPVSALDVSVRAQVLNLLDGLQKDLGLTLLFISHDIGVVAHISDRVAVMYLGRIVETGETAEVLARPLHPYTRALLNAVPASHPRLRRERRPLEGDPPSPSDPPSGCRFHPRCPIAVARCATEVPVLEQIAGGSFAACHRAGEAIDSNSIRQEPQ